MNDGPKQWRIVEMYAGYRVVSGDTIIEALDAATSAGAKLGNIIEVTPYNWPDGK